MSKISVVGFQKEFQIINLKLMNEDIKKYDRLIILAYTLELEHGFIVKKIYKTTKKGTKFTFKACENQEEADKYSRKVNDLIDGFNKKYAIKYK